MDDQPSEQPAADSAAAVLTLADLQAAGLYDPSSPHAEDRREVLEALVARGATLEQLTETDRIGRLAALAGDLLVASPGQYTMDELAERIGLTHERIVSATRASGLPVPDPDDRAFSDADADMLLALSPALELFDRDVALQLLRVISTSLARIADASVAAYVDDVERRISESGGTELDHLRSVDAAIGVLGGTIDALGPLLARHVGLAMVRSRRSREDVSGYEVGRLAIGFVDLVGFTSLTQHVSAGELGRLVTDFEATAADLIADHDGRLVKLIGDEVMFAAVDPHQGCAIGLDLVDAFRDDDRGIVPRGAVTYGEVLVRAGDYYGPEVNLAARLADEAVPLEILATSALREAAGDDGLAFEPAGRRMLQGFDDPVAVWSVEPA